MRDPTSEIKWCFFTSVELYKFISFCVVFRQTSTCLNTTVMALSKDCDPAGDLVLKVGSGDEATLIRVHSKVLSLASPVFAAMLSPRFAEGKTLEDNKGTVDSPTAINLPDDDPEAMSLICRILHFKEDAAQQPCYQRFTMMRLAQVCEKYDMSRTLSPWSNIWINESQTIPPLRECPGSRFDRAWVSYALRHNKSFWEITRDIARYSTLAELEIEHSFLPDNVICESPVQPSLVG